MGQMYLENWWVRDSEKQKRMCVKREIFMNRIKWIDSSKAIAIMLVVIGHMIGDLENPVNRFILAFHMPFFFFISGYLSNAEKKWGGVCA